MNRLLAAALISIASAAAGCSAIVGDSCTTQTDCGSAMYCELSLPDGYCTLKDCVYHSCPDSGVCVRFTEDTSYCMLQCKSNADCRGGYRCVTDFGLYPFCNDSGGETPVNP